MKLDPRDWANYSLTDFEITLSHSHIMRAFNGNNLFRYAGPDDWSVVIRETRESVHPQSIGLTEFLVDGEVPPETFRDGMISIIRFTIQQRIETAKNLVENELGNDAEALLTFLDQA